VILKALAVWFGILVAAIANGAFREGVLIPQLGKTPGLILSGVLLSTLIVLVTWLALPWLGATAPPQLIRIGIAWLLLTLVFEFSFGRLRGKSWDDILAAYSFADGNLWPIVLLVTAAAPYIAGRLRGLP
jgi:hypothetical protein